MTEELPEVPGFRYVRPLGKNVHLYRGADGDVAVKLLVDSPRVNEIRTVAELRHPGIVPVHRAGRTRAGLPYLVMRYFPNGDLAAAAFRGNPHLDQFAFLRPIRIPVNRTKANRPVGENHKRRAIASASGCIRLCLPTVGVPLQGGLVACGKRLG